ncbi:DUF1326 domain-containing protein [Nordella sp. HKS 07]|uniref:DUF1326 domain-containing protein n=1 Tax=Nordella sp. HKS 07 TaxID=2712222 RepID=UPI0013E134D9|nr:DUF1326 domain-containing protein [Nordella sp. HKS 07]QIG51388.1 DUF1326 domain-containing protein [Nordella sp. HKS 07]
MIDWMIRGPEIATCNCAYGCPCQFNALPTEGNCSAGVAMRIDKGHFGDVQLDGLHWAGVFAWPGPIHEGHGQAQPVIDERASPEQRAALLAIMSGQESKPGATYFQVFSAMIDTVHEPLFKPISFTADIDAATGQFKVDGVIDAMAEPIRNPVTGEPHRPSISLRDGFEFLAAEFASSTTKTQGAIAREWAGRHAHLTMIHITGEGVVR